MIEPVRTIISRLREPLRLALAVVVCCMLVDALVYRSGWYAKVAEPDSNMGAVTSMRMLAATEYRQNAHNVLVLGDSRVAEGFSALVASQQQPRLNFINVAIPGSMPRTWWYLLRQFERDGYHPDAVVVGAVYAPRDGTDLANWPLDPGHQLPLLQLSDYPDYLASIHADDMRRQVREFLLLPTLSVQNDLRSLLQAPLQRITKLLEYRPGYLASVPLYPGREEHMPALYLNADGALQSWNDATEAQKHAISSHAAELKTPVPAAITSANRNYQQTWYLKIADWCLQHHVKLIVFPVPRGPYHAIQPVRTEPSAIRTALVNHPAAQVLPDDTFDSLETAGYFFDTLHLNHSGRELLSQQLATQVAAALSTDAP